MKQVVIENGKPAVIEVPAPVVQRGFVLIGLEYSCVSVGTELASIGRSGSSLLARVIKQPENIAKAARLLVDQGLAATVQRIQGATGSVVATGYSGAGRILELGQGVTGLAVGDRVACAGAGYASHAELVAVPRNLVVKLPDSVSLAAGATVTLGAIAMQGVRRAGVAIGENVVVFGLGVIGQITVQLLASAGCNVWGLDIDGDACRRAKDLGADFTLNPDTSSVDEILQGIAGGAGADAVIVTASSASHELISNAAKLCRKKGRVVIVGDVGLSINREDIYAKELDVLISTSYGPGRYDNTYEVEGADYPYAYVRWTENRNMQGIVRLLERGRLDVESLTREPVPIEACAEAFVRSGDGAPPIRLIRYAQLSSADLPARVQRTEHPVVAGPVRVGVAGLGDWALGKLLPELDKSPRFSITAIASRDGLKARHQADRYKAALVATDYAELFASDQIDLVVIATRHDTHGQLVLNALGAQKHVFVEKPLTLSISELDQIRQFYERDQHARPLLMTGFNRRFAPAIARLKRDLQEDSSPKIINYVMNAGFLPKEHWTHGSQGGGRNLGEACHIYDLFQYLVEDHVTSLSVHSLSTPQYSSGDNFVATIEFSRGSICTLTYTSMGTARMPKEEMTVYGNGEIYRLNDFKELTTGKNGTIWHSSKIDKGHSNQLEALANSLGEKSAWPISLGDQISATQIAFQVQERLDKSI